MIKYFKSLGLALLLSVGFGSVGQAASFVCNKATTETEVAICADPYLSALDDLIASAYFEAKRSWNDKQALIESQRAWILKRNSILQDFSRDDEEYLSAEDELHETLSLRFSELLNALSGVDYDTVIEIFKRTEPVSLKVEKNKRVLVFSTGESYYSHNVVFFNSDHKLVKAIPGLIYWRMSACEETFDLRTDDHDSSKLSYIFSCGNGGRHGWSEYTFTITEKCIMLNNYTRHQGQLSETTGQGYKYLDGNNYCLEQSDYNFDATVPSFVSWSYDDPEAIVRSTPTDLLSLLTKYWQKPPVTGLINKTGQDLTCKTTTLALARINLINLFEHFTLDDSNPPNGILYHPTEYAYILNDPWNWDYQYSALIEIYKNNSKTYDLFLPVVKLLDQNNEIGSAVEFLISSRENADLKIKKFNNSSPNNGKQECEGPYFEVSANGVTAKVHFESQMPPLNPDYVHKSFWERREADGTAEVTMEILEKINTVLSD